MKRMLIPVLIMFFIAFAYSCTKGQTMISSQNPFPAPESKESYKWTPSAEFGFTSKLENDAKFPVLDAPVNFAKFTFQKEHYGGVSRLSSTIGAGTKRMRDQGYYGFRAERIQYLNKHVEVLAGTKFDFTRSVRYGSIFGGGALRFGKESNFNHHPKQRTANESKIFSRVDYYFPTGNHLHINKGIAFTNGFEGRFENQDMMFEPSARIIFDSGSIHPGKRTLGNFEVLLGYKYSKLCIGGGLDYTKKISGHFHHDQSVVGKFFIRYN